MATAAQIIQAAGGFSPFQGLAQALDIYMTPREKQFQTLVELEVERAEGADIGKLKKDLQTVNNRLRSERDKRPRVESVNEKLEGRVDRELSRQITLQQKLEEQYDKKVEKADEIRGEQIIAVEKTKGELFQGDKVFKEIHTQLKQDYRKKIDWDKAWAKEINNDSQLQDFLIHSEITEEEFKYSLAKVPKELGAAPSYDLDEVLLMKNQGHIVPLEGITNNSYTDLFIRSYGLKIGDGIRDKEPDLIDNTVNSITADIQADPVNVTVIRAQDRTDIEKTYREEMGDQYKHAQGVDARREQVIQNLEAKELKLQEQIELGGVQGIPEDPYQAAYDKFLTQYGGTKPGLHTTLVAKRELDQDDLDIMEAEQLGNEPPEEVISDFGVDDPTRQADIYFDEQPTGQEAEVLPGATDQEVERGKQNLIDTEEEESLLADDTDRYFVDQMGTNLTDKIVQKVPLEERIVETKTMKEPTPAAPQEEESAPVRDGAVERLREYLSGIREDKPVRTFISERREDKPAQFQIENKDKINEINLKLGGDFAKTGEEKVPLLAIGTEEREKLLAELDQAIESEDAEALNIILEKINTTFKQTSGEEPEPPTAEQLLEEAKSLRASPNYEKDTTLYKVKQEEILNLLEPEINELLKQTNEEEANLEDITDQILGVMPGTLADKQALLQLKYTLSGDEEVANSTGKVLNVINSRSSQSGTPAEETAPEAPVAGEKIEDTPPGIEEFLQTNKNVRFVDRILNPNKYPVQENDDGTVSTHLMAYAEIDGRYVVYPTLQWDGKKLVKGNIQSALAYDNVIYFDTEEEAAGFASQDAPWKQVLKERSGEAPPSAPPLPPEEEEAPAEEVDKTLNIKKTRADFPPSSGGGKTETMFAVFPGDNLEEAKEKNHVAWFKTKREAKQFKNQPNAFEKITESKKEEEKPLEKVEEKIQDTAPLSEDVPKEEAKSPEPYVVVTGDSFSKIAKKLKIPEQELRNLNPDLAAKDWLHPGDEMKLPVKEEE